tara:strand:- start:5020 stop:5823 length:804 start_codon:yes stop_codon:yes gene_type:complete
LKQFIILLIALATPFLGGAQQRPKIIAFYTAKNDLAHISFVKEALPWFENQAEEVGYEFYSTSDWKEMNGENLAKYQLVVFLDTRPEITDQREAFESYMKNGGAWMGFHFSAFALTPSDFPQDWNWYHEVFLGSGQYASNTWRPTSATLKVEQPLHEIFEGISATLKAAPNEWYRWEHDLRTNPDIQILASIDPSSFPLGTGPKAHEIWREGYYPVIWTNKNYRMIYFNMGHNDMDYDGGTNETLSSTFESPDQERVFINSLKWLLE